MKRLGLTALSMAALLIAIPQMAETQKIKRKRPLMLTKRLPKLAPGDTIWAHVFWQGRNISVENMQMTVTAPDGYLVAYPGGRAYASPNQGNVLDVDEIDYATFRLTVPPTATKSNIKLQVQLSYEQAGKQLKKKYKVRVPVRLTKNDDIEMLSQEVGPLAPNANTWVHLQFEGHANCSGFELVVLDSAGAGIYYPGGRTYSGLAQNSTLDDGEIDYAALKIDTNGMAEGDYTLKAELRFMVAGASAGSTIPLDIPMTVSAASGDALTMEQQVVDMNNRVATMRLNAGVEHAGKPFQVLGSLAGTDGVSLSNAVVPLTLDPYFVATMKRQAARPLIDGVGTLDTKGKGWATFLLRKKDFAKWSGQTVHHAFVVYGDGGLEFVSNACPLVIGQ